jgi:molybdopterin biosynthesis enzyme
MISVEGRESASSRIRLPAERKPLLAAPAVLAEDVIRRGSAAALNTGMDGYAVRAAGWPGPADRAGPPARDREPAASYVSDVPVGPGEAVRIMTGAHPARHRRSRAVSKSSIARPERTAQPGRRDNGFKAASPCNVRERGGDVRAGRHVSKPAA